jgi:hypothetical protein
VPVITIQPPHTEYKESFAHRENDRIQTYVNGQYVYIEKETYKSYRPKVGFSTLIATQYQKNQDYPLYGIYEYAKVFLRFPIYGIPKNVKITNAILALYPSNQNYPDARHALSIYALNEHIFDSINYLPEHPIPKYNSTPLDSVAVPPDKWINFNVTSYIQGIVEQSQENFGFCIRLNPEEAAVGENVIWSFYSYTAGVKSTYDSSGNLTGYIVDESINALRPKLIVEYVEKTQIPINLEPFGLKVRADEPIKLSWKFGAYDASSNQTKYSLMYSANNGLWNTVIKESTEPFHTFATGSLPVGEIKWKVKTWAANGADSDYSNEASFTVVQPPPKPTITVPTENTISTGNPIIQWTSTAQTEYELIIQDAQQKNVFYKKENTTNKQVQVSTLLKNGENYKIQLRTKDTNGIWSAFLEKTFSVSLSIPIKPKVFVSAVNNEMGAVTLTIQKDVNIVSYDVLRKSEEVPEYKTKATGVATNTYTDYTQCSDKKYWYTIRAYNSQGGYIDSDPILSIVSLPCSLLALASDPQQNLKLYMRAGVTETIQKESYSQKFAGRKYPIVEFYGHEDVSLNLSFKTHSYMDIEKLKELMDFENVLLYRDQFGKSIYGTISGLNTDYNNILNYWSFSFTINKTNEV